MTLRQSATVLTIGAVGHLKGDGALVQGRDSPDLARLGRSDEAELVDACLNGDMHAYALIVEQQLPAVLQVARRMLGDDAEAEDVAQDVFMRFWRSLDRFDASKAKLSTYLYRIASNVCIDRLRQRKARPLDSQDISDVEVEMPASQETDLQRAELSKRVDDALQGLPERQRLALVLFHFEELSMGEVGGILACSVEAVESLLSRARRSLRTELEEEWRGLLPDQIF